MRKKKVQRDEVRTKRIHGGIRIVAGPLDAFEPEPEEKVDPETGPIWYQPIAPLWEDVLTELKAKEVQRHHRSAARQAKWAKENPVRRQTVYELEKQLFESGITQKEPTLDEDEEYGPFYPSVEIGPVYCSDKFNCEECNRSFRRVSWWHARRMPWRRTYGEKVATPRGVFCSDACFNERVKFKRTDYVARRTERNAKAAAARRTVENGTCKQCGAPMQAARSTRQFCSTKCRVAFNSAKKYVTITSCFNKAAKPTD